MNYSKLVGSIFSLILNYVSTTWHSHNNVSTWLPVPSFIFWNNSFLVSTKTWQRLCADVTRLARLHAECKFRFRQWYKDLWCLCCRCLTNLRAFMFIKAHSKYILHLKRKRIYVLNEMDSLLFLASYFHFFQSTFCLSIVYNCTFHWRCSYNHYLSLHLYCHWPDFCLVTCTTCSFLNLWKNI